MNLKKSFIVVACIAISLPAFVFQVSAQQKVLFERAKFTMETKGDLEGAIELFEKIIVEYPEDRPVVAKALLHIGMCYEKLGLQVAQNAYQRIVSEFADQIEVVNEARTRLTALELMISAEPEGIVVRQVLTEPIADVYAGAVSPDGSYFAFGDWENSNGDLAVCELATGDTRLLTNSSRETNQTGWVQSSIFSPDGKKLAYSWYNEDEFYDLRTVGLDGSQPKVIYRDPGTSSFDPPADWSRDGRFVLGYLLRNEDHIYQIVTISVPEGSLRVLKTLDKRSPGNMCFSPDGRYIAYDFPANEGASNHDIFLLDMDGGEETDLVEHPANDLVLGWAPDGNFILFESDRTGSRGAWLISIEDGKPEGPSKLIKRDIGQITPMGFTRNGSFFYGIGGWAYDVYVAEVDLAEGKLLNEPEPLIQHYMGKNRYSAWSYDGKYLAYVSERMGVPGGPVICIRDDKTGKERELLPKLDEFQSLQWSPDGHSILVMGVDLTVSKSWGCFRIDTLSGEVTVLIESGIGTTLPQWNVDGKSIFYVRNKWSENLSQILVRDLDTGQEEEIARAPENSNFAWIVISRDGQRLAFTKWQEEKEPWSLMVMPTKGGEMTEILKYRPKNVAWSPDGKKLLFTKSIESAGASTSNELWLISVEGGEPKSMGILPMRISNLSVHPDGTRIIFTSPEYKSEIWVMENFLPEIKK